MNRRWFLGAYFLASAAVCCLPAEKFDPPAHAALGRWIVEHRAVPSRDFLSWTKSGQPWIDSEWGTDILYYALDRAGGMGALWSFKVAGFIVIMLLFAAVLRLWHLPDPWIGLALIPFILSLVPMMDIRPEIASYILCLVELHMLEAGRRGKLPAKNRGFFLAHAVLYALWANLHPGYPIGLALCLAYGAGEWIQGNEVSKWFGAAAAGFAGSLFNPRGLNLYMIFYDRWRRMELLRANIIEWAPPNLFEFHQRAFLVLFLFSFFAFIHRAFKKRSIPYAHYLSLLAFGLLASRVYRYMPYFSLIVFPMALGAAYSSESPKWWPRTRPFVLAGSFLFLGIGAWRVLSEKKLFQGIDKTAGRKLASAAEFLARNETVLAPLRMYCSMQSGSYLEYALYPNYKVFMDGRDIFYEYYPLIGQASVTPSAWQRFMSSQHIEIAVREISGMMVADTDSRLRIVWRPIEAYYMPRKDWALVYWDGKAAIWAKRGSLPRTWVLHHELRS